jgi:epoxyqueuosine reductase QueG
MEMPAANGELNENIETISNGELIKQKLIEWGATKVGLSRVEDKLPDEYKSLKYAVTVMIHLSDFIIDELKDKPTYTYFHHYRTVNTLIDQITLSGMLLIQERGYYAMAVPASQTVESEKGEYRGIFPHKTAAVRAGLGWIGKNALLVTEEFGPRVRLGTILTDMPVVQEYTDFSLTSRCGDCRVCTEACPAMALKGRNWTEGCDRSEIVDARACSEFMSKKYKHIGRGSVCGLCMSSCPRGKNKKAETKFI